MGSSGSSFIVEQQQQFVFQQLQFQRRHESAGSADMVFFGLGCGSDPSGGASCAPPARPERACGSTPERANRFSNRRLQGEPPFLLGVMRPPQRYSSGWPVSSQARVPPRGASPACRSPQPAWRPPSPNACPIGNRAQPRAHRLGLAQDGSKRSSAIVVLRRGSFLQQTSSSVRTSIRRIIARRQPRGQFFGRHVDHRVRLAGLRTAAASSSAEGLAPPQQVPVRSRRNRGRVPLAILARAAAAGSQCQQGRSGKKGGAGRFSFPLLMPQSFAQNVMENAAMGGNIPFHSRYLCDTMR